MRQGSNGRRPRGRPNRKQHGSPGRSNTFDSSGPEGRIRGNAHQVYEKYLGLARDAASAGDRIAAEAFYQHAEHYFRIVNDSTDPGPAEGSAEARERSEARGRQQRAGNGSREPRVNGNNAQPQVEFPGEVAGAETTAAGIAAPKAADEASDNADAAAGKSRQAGDADGQETGRRRSEGSRTRRRGRPPRAAADTKEATPPAAAEPEMAPASKDGDEVVGKTNEKKARIRTVEKSQAYFSCRYFCNG